VYMTFIC